MPLWKSRYEEVSVLASNVHNALALSELPSGSSVKEWHIWNPNEKTKLIGLKNI